MNQAILLFAPVDLGPNEHKLRSLGFWHQNLYLLLCCSCCTLKLNEASQVEPREAFLVITTIDDVLYSPVG